VKMTDDGRILFDVLYDEMMVFKIRPARIQWMKREMKKFVPIN